MVPVSGCVRLVIPYQTPGMSGRETSPPLAPRRQWSHASPPGGFFLSEAGVTLSGCRSSSLPAGHTSTPIPAAPVSAWVRSPSTVPHPFTPFRSPRSMACPRAGPATQMLPGSSSSSVAARSAGPPVPALTTVAFTYLSRLSTGEDQPSCPRGRSSTAGVGSGRMWLGCTPQLEKLNRYV